jgi:hypothetical protein
MAAQKPSQLISGVTFLAPAQMARTFVQCGARDLNGAQVCTGKSPTNIPLIDRNRFEHLDVTFLSSLESEVVGQAFSGEGR